MEVLSERETEVPETWERQEEREAEKTNGREEKDGRQRGMRERDRKGS